MEHLKTEIQSLAKAYHQEVVGYRRHLHQYPELSFQEEETGKFVTQKLKEFGIEYQAGVAGHGVVAMIRGRNPEKKNIALRGDMDALPIQEANAVAYKSKNDGVMHACGHDVHTSSLLGVAKILQQVKDQFEGSIKLIFQPGEEKAPYGASLMIKEGVLEHPTPTLIFGQHVHPPMEAGKVGFKPDRFMASKDDLYLCVKGTGGHGALPQDCVDPVPIMAQIITALQQVISRKADPGLPSVMTFGSVHSTGGTTNTIAQEILLEGTFRTFDETWRKEAHRLMQQIVTGISTSLGATATLEIKDGCPSLLNNREATLFARQNAREYLGEENVIDLPIRMTSEDFAFYSHQVPAVFYRLGTRNVNREIPLNVHTPSFDIDESALETSIGVMAWLAVCELQK